MVMVDQNLIIESFWGNKMIGNLGGIMRDPLSTAYDALYAYLEFATFPNHECVYQILQAGRFTMKMMNILFHLALKNY